MMSALEARTYNVLQRQLQAKMMAGAIAKPQMRRLLEANIKKALIGACLTSIASGVAWKIFVMDARKKAYADFYKTYDPITSMIVMCDAGLLQSCEPGERDFV